MAYFAAFLLALVSYSLIDNVLLSRFYGICSFIGVGNKVKSAVSMGIAVVFVIVFSALICYPIYNFVLVPAGLAFMSIDLAKESATERTFTIQGAVSGEAGQMVIGVKTNAIHIVSSKCPNQYCVHTGWISDAAHPIVCAYNHISITIVGSTGADVVV